MPLLFQPGREWSYGMSTDVLGMVVEAAAGVPFADAVHERVLDPLGMTETTWHVEDDHAARLAALYTPQPGSGTAVRLDSLGAAARHRPTATMGGSGLCSTAPDYLRFAEMLRRRGELEGVRILAPSTVDRMASNHLPDNADLSEFGRPLFSETAYDGVGYGLGVSVLVDPIKARISGSVGDHGWGGAASTSYWVDPVLDLTVLFLTQLLPSDSWPLRSQLRQLVHAALTGA